MFRIAARIGASNVERSIQVVDENIQRQMGEKYGEDATNTYKVLKKEVFGKIDNDRINMAINSIAKQQTNSTPKNARQASNQMEDLITSVQDEITENSSITSKTKVYMNKITLSFMEVTQANINLINTSTQVINGLEVIPSDIIIASSLSSKLNEKVAAIEKDVVNDNNLSEQDRKQIYQYCATILNSSPNLALYFSDNSNESIKNGRAAGWFSKVKNVFRSVVATVVTVAIVAAAVVTAVYCPPCVVAVAKLVGVATATSAVATYITTAAIATGFVVGTYVGTEVGYAVVCANPIDESQCYECVSDAVTFGGIPYTSFVGNLIFDCEFCEEKFPGFTRRNVGLCR